MKFRYLVCLCITSLMCSIALTTYSQRNINFGSNNGTYLIVDGKKIYYEEYGKGTPLLMLHGGLSSISGLRTIIPALSRHFRVIAIDAPGQGRSEQSDSLSFQIMSKVYSSMIDQLRLDSVYVYGFSLGGIVALHLAADRPDKVKLVVAHSVATHRDGYNESFGNSDLMTAQDIEQHGQWWLEGHKKRSPEPEKWKKFITDLRSIWIPHQFVPKQKLQAIIAPCLFLLGDQDMIKLDHAIAVQQSVKQGQLCILPNTTHFSLFENPQDVINILLPFLQRTSKKPFEFTY